MIAPIAATSHAGDDRAVLPGEHRTTDDHRDLTRHKQVEKDRSLADREQQHHDQEHRAVEIVQALEQRRGHGARGRSSG